MIISVIPSVERFHPKEAVTIIDGEWEDYDFDPCAKQIFKVLSVLSASNLIKGMPYDSPDEIVEVIVELLFDIDFDDIAFQQSEKRHIRLEYQDRLMSVEVFLGV